MGKAMVNATNLVAHVTIVAHLNMTEVACHGPTVTFVIKSNSCYAAMWHTINDMMETLNPNPNLNTCKVGPCDTWRFKLSKY
jgi:hypothetical protein